MEYISTSNLTSPRGGRYIANQYVINIPSGWIFKSHDSLIAIIDYEKQGAAHLTIGKNWDCSRTTTKYLCEFLKDYAAHIFGSKVNKGRILQAIANKDIEFDPNLA